MRVMGTNTWEMDVDVDILIDQALAFANMLEAQGIAQLVGAWVESDKKLMWCTWITDDLAALEAAFDQMNERSGLTSELSVVEEMYPERTGRDQRDAELLSGAGLA